jgi:hypothetical protein
MIARLLVQLPFEIYIREGEQFPLYEYDDGPYRIRTYLPLHYKNNCSCFHQLCRWAFSALHLSCGCRHRLSSLGLQLGDSGNKQIKKIPISHRTILAFRDKLDRDVEQG